ncbi:hypothetical protein GCM10028789_04440 [Sinomonas halotolerans]
MQLGGGHNPTARPLEHSVRRIAKTRLQRHKEPWHRPESKMGKRRRVEQRPHLRVLPHA